jgi:hypothetical protein
MVRVHPILYHQTSPLSSLINTSPYSAMIDGGGGDGPIIEPK